MSCKFNSIIDCRPDAHDCSNCGWNPDVRKQRLKDLGSKIQTQKIPEHQPVEYFITVLDSSEEGVKEVKVFKTLDEASLYISNHAIKAYDPIHEDDETGIHVTPEFACVEDGNVTLTWSVHRVTV